MMILDRTKAPTITLGELLVRPHIVIPIVSMLDLNHTRLADISYMFSDGQVTIDADADVTRSCSMTLFDPLYRIGLDSKNPSDGALFLDRMVAAYLQIIDPTTFEYYTAPVFCGPLTKMDRDWAWVSLEAQGKETFGLREAWLPKSYYSGALKTDVIKDILRRFLGETDSKMNIPSLSSRISATVSITQETKPWEKAKELARSMAYQLFYDGRGVVVMRKLPVTSTWSFTEGKGTWGASLLSKPQVGYDMDNLVNAVYVKGGTPSGSTTSISVKRVAPSSHPLSPTSLGRGGAGRYYWKKIEDTSIVTLSEANAVAAAELNVGLMQATSITFDSLVIPNLEEWDQVNTLTSEFGYTHQLKKYTIPLLPSGKSTFGYLRNVSVNKARIRNAR